MNCIFCKIISGEAPSYKIYEDAHTLGFLDRSMDILGHTLVIPKKHVRNILDCDAVTLAHVMTTVKKISNYYVDHCNFEGIDILNANEPAAQQSVFHLHFHVIPRKIGDAQNAWPVFSGCRTPLEAVHQRLKMT